MEGCDQLFQLSTLGYKCFLYLAKVLNVTDSPFEQVYYFKAKAWTSVPSSVVKKIRFSGKTIMYYSFLKPDMSLDNGLYALGNDEEVRRMDEYIRLGYKMIENDANVIGESSFRHEDEDNFDPFFGLDSEPVDATTTRNKCVDKGKGVALNDDQVHVATGNTMENETWDENNDGDSSESSEHDELVVADNELVDVAVDIDHFDRTNAKTIGNKGTPEFIADEEFDIGMDVIDTEEFESTYDVDGIDRIMKFPNSVKVKDLVHMHSIETKRELYLKKNDKVRVRAACRGTIPVFNTSCDIRPSQVGESNQTQGAFKKDLDLQDHSNFTFISDRRKGIIPAVSELFPAAEYRYCLRHILENRKLRLETWRQVYSHHINPIRGKIMWPKSPIPTTILPLNHQSTVCRPSLKIRTENKSAGQGHNKRSCIGPRKDAGNKGSISNAGKKRPRSETTTRTSQAAKKPKNAHIGVQTRSQASNKGNQPTAAAKKPINKGKKIV
ncbi:hypothetical protein Tco_1361034 [Tanacetum coccineum]